MRKHEYNNILTKQFLQKEYIQNKKSTIQIANMVKCNSSTVCNYLKKYLIKIRNDSECHRGFEHTEDTKIKMSKQRKGQNCYWYGKKRPDISERMSGENSWNWKASIKFPPKVVYQQIPQKRNTV